MSDLIERSQALNAINIAMSVSGAWENVAKLPSAQPELLEHEAYIRGFEQGRTQGMIDAQERKK